MKRELNLEEFTKRLIDKGYSEGEASLAISLTYFYQFKIGMQTRPDLSEELIDLFEEFSKDFFTKEKLLGFSPFHLEELIMLVVDVDRDKARLFNDVKVEYSLWLQKEPTEIKFDDYHIIEKD
jgi:hypothetical protein